MTSPTPALVNTKVWPDGDFIHDRCVTRRTEAITGQPGWQEVRSQHVRYKITHQRIGSYEQQEVEQQVAVKFEGLKVFTKWCNKIEETRCEPPAAANNNHANALAGTFEPRLTLSRQWEDEMVFDFSGYFSGAVPTTSFSPPLHRGEGQQAASPPPPNPFSAQAPPNPFQSATPPGHFLSAAQSSQYHNAAPSIHFQGAAPSTQSQASRPPHQPAPVRPSARASLPPLPPPNQPRAVYGELLHQHARSSAHAQAQAQAQAQAHQPRGASLSHYHPNAYPAYTTAQLPPGRPGPPNLLCQEISDDDDYDHDELFVPSRPRAPRAGLFYTTTDDQDSEYMPPAAKKRGKRKSKTAAMAQQHTMSGGLGRRGSNYDD